MLLASRLEHFPSFLTRLQKVRSPSDARLCWAFLNGSEHGSLPDDDASKLGHCKRTRVPRFSRYSFKLSPAVTVDRPSCERNEGRVEARV